MHQISTCLPTLLLGLFASAGVAQAQFGPPNTISSEISNACGFTPADVDGDGDPDLVAVTCDATEVK